VDELDMELNFVTTPTWTGFTPGEFGAIACNNNLIALVVRGNGKSWVRVYDEEIGFGDFSLSGNRLYTKICFAGDHTLALYGDECLSFLSFPTKTQTTVLDCVSIESMTYIDGKVISCTLPRGFKAKLPPIINIVDGTGDVCITTGIEPEEIALAPDMSQPLCLTSCDKHVYLTGSLSRVVRVFY
jgi:hypothetical protein